MSFEVVLPFSGDGCGFHIYLKSTRFEDVYIHEFRPDAEMASWLKSGCASFLSYETIWSHDVMSFMSHMQFTFGDANEAMLFKLTWA